MDDELIQMLSTGQGGDALEAVSVAGGIEQEEIELTQEMKNTMPVVNKSRKQNRLSGVSNFLANPEVQNMLLQFGRAFAGNQPGEAGTILADAGEGVIRESANSRALKAFESGKPIAESAGRFADAGLVAGLQQRRQEGDLTKDEMTMRREQFAEEMNFSERVQEFREANAEQDILLRTAAQNMNAEQFESNLQLRKDQLRVEEEYRDAQAEYWRGLLAKESGSGGVVDLSAQTNRFIETLNERTDILERRKSALEGELNDLNRLTFEGFDSEGNPKFTPTGDFDAGNPQFSYDPWGPNFMRDTSPELAADYEKGLALAKELEGTMGQINRTQRDLQQVQAVQASRLGVEDGEAGGTDEDDDTPTSEQPLGTLENPIQTTPMQARSLPPGSIYTAMGVVYRVGENGGGIELGLLGEVGNNGEDND